MNKKMKIYVIIVIIIIFVCLILSQMIKQNASKNMEVEKSETEIDKTNKIQEENEDLKEVKVNGYHLVTYNQSANQNSLIQSLIVHTLDESKVRFVIGSIDSNSIVKERMEFEVNCISGKNEFDLSDKRYLLKEEEYLFMDIEGQDVLYSNSNSKENSFVQTENNKKEGKMIMTLSDFIVPFEYTLDEISEYNVLTIGNNIFLKDEQYDISESNESNESLDYYNLTKNRLQEIFHTVNMNYINGIDWEKAENSQKRMDWVNHNLLKQTVSNLDLVIFQLGDNYDFNNEFENDMHEMIQYIRKYSPGTEMIYIGMWFTNDEKDNKLPGICERTGMRFIDISDLKDNSEYESVITVVENGKEKQTNYPNNEAMQIISNRIIETLGF